MPPRQTATITLTTDFGIDDEYAGVVKGVIYSKTTDVHIVDLTHTIPPFDIEKTSYLIASAYEYFPPGSIHVVIVDPGVGGERDIILLKAGGHFFLAPDNGVLSLIIKRHKDCHAFRVTNRDLFLESPCPTFHGRDIFAPVAGCLARGVDPLITGPKIPANELCLLPLPEPVIDPTKKQITGEIIAIDHFGNAMTNIHKNNLKEISSSDQSTKRFSLSVKDSTLYSLNETYQNTSKGKALTLFTSRNYLEIAVNQGNAAQMLQIQPHDPVFLRLL